MQYFNGITPLLGQYSTFLLDQWGVLHSGEKVYPKALQTLIKLQEENKEVIIISNSGKRAEHNENTLKKCGIDRSLYKMVISSGEVFWQEYTKQTLLDTNVETCYFINTGTDEILENLSITTVDTIAKADFILLASIEHGSHETWLAKLLPFAKQSIPLVCLNPDKLMLSEKKTALGPGYIAEEYEKKGGKVIFIGKPFPLIYRYAKDNIQEKQNPILAVGDSLEHDIVGATEQNIDNLFITQGIFASSLTENMNPEVVSLQITNMTQKQASPTYWSHWFSL